MLRRNFCLVSLIGMNKFLVPNWFWNASCGYAATYLWPCITEVPGVDWFGDQVTQFESIVARPIKSYWQFVNRWTIRQFLPVESTQWWHYFYRSHHTSAYPLRTALGVTAGGVFWSWFWSSEALYQRSGPRNPHLDWMVRGIPPHSQLLSKLFYWAGRKGISVWLVSKIQEITIF